MRCSLVFAALGGLLLLAGGAMATPPANNGYIGVFGDAAGTSCCIQLNGGGNGLLYVFAVTGGSSSAGITGAEFRVSIEPADPGATFSWSPAAGVLVSSGNPVDNGAGGGVSMSFQSCQTQTGMAGDKVLLGTIHVQHMTTEHQLVVKPHTTPNPNFACPSVLLCDGPTATQVCLTLQEGDPDLYGKQPAAFTTSVNSPACTGVTCGYVAVEATDWTTIKHLYQ